MRIITNARMLTPRQLIAARAFIGWTRHDLAAASETSPDTIQAFEGRGSNPTLKTVQAWISALHKAGVILIDEDETSGPGVRLKKGVKAVAVPPRGRRSPEAKAKAKGKGRAKA